MSVVAQQVAEFFAERGLKPVVVEGFARLHAVKAGQERLPLCTQARRAVREQPDRPPSARAGRPTAPAVPQVPQVCPGVASEAGSRVMAFCLICDQPTHWRRSDRWPVHSVTGERFSPLFLGHYAVPTGSGSRGEHTGHGLPGPTGNDPEAVGTPPSLSPGAITANLRRTGHTFVSGGER